MSLGPEQTKMVREVSRLLHADNRRDAAIYFSDWAELKLKISSDDPRVCNPPLQHLLHFLLDNGAPDLAANLLWKPNQFTSEPQSVKDIWNLFETAQLGIIMAAASVGKTFSLGVRLLLEYARDPAYTTVKVIGPSESHLEENLFSHLVSLHQQSSLPLPGEVGEMFIGLDRRNRLSSISGVVIPRGQTRKAGKIQGTKRKPRPTAHPIFGELSRLFIFLDEAENIPKGIFSDIDNAVSNSDENESGGFKIFMAYNPTQIADSVGQRAEPEKGWAAFDIDNDFRWRSRRGWEVLRIDAERTENVVAGRTIYPGLQTRAGLEMLARNSGGKTSAGYSSMGRGAYPPQGMELTIIPSGMLAKMRGDFIWQEAPAPVGSCDLALEGGASAIFTKGLVGKASGIKYPPSLEFPKGRIIMFHGKDGRSVVPRWGLQAESQFTLPKGDSVKMAAAIIDLARKAGIKPNLLALDRTGHGAGVCDIIANEWSSAIHSLNYSEGASETRLMVEDSKTCKELYDRAATELWFALRAFAEFGVLLISPSMDLEKLSQQLTQRHFRTAGQKSRVEPKSEYVLRGFTSPDEADSLTLFVHAARRGQAIIPSMTGQSDTEDGDDDWLDGSTDQRIDSSNRSQYLDETIPRYSIL